MGTTMVRCFQCGRRGIVPSRLLLVRSAEAILCPRCRGKEAAFVHVPVPTAVRPAIGAGTPRPQPRRLVGRPPLFLVRSKDPSPPTGDRPASRVGPPPLTFAVRCSGCGRNGHLPARLRATIRAEDIICPNCRDRDPTHAPGLRPAGRNAPRVIAIHCFSCHRRGRLTLRGSRRIRPELLICPSCRSVGPVGRPTAAPGRVPAKGMFPVVCFACGRAGRLPVAVQTALRPEEVLCPTCRTKNPLPLPLARWPSWSVDGAAVI
ncbi:MAG: hypothetical protein ACYDFT_01445 [Thermoplasmata archaeon]